MLKTAAVTECTTNSPIAFDAKINNWAEGVLMTIDADSSKLTIRGANRPYASEYAKMLKKIHRQTAKMSREDSARQASEIRLGWKSALEKAHAQEAEKDSDLTFKLPGEQGKLVILDETPFYNREGRTATNLTATPSLTDKECKAIHALKDLQVGECVVVGYDSGVLNNDAYVVIKGDKRSAK